MEQGLTKDEFHKAMEEERRITFALLDEQTQKVMADPIAFAHLLNMIAGGVSTTVSNTLLVQAQFPSATVVLPKEDWEANKIPVFTDDEGHYPAGIRQFAADGEYLGKDNRPHTQYKLFKGFDAEQTVDPVMAREYMIPKPPSKIFIGTSPLKALNKALFSASPVECLVYDKNKFIDPAEDISEAIGVRYIPQTKAVVIRRIKENQWYPVITYEIALGMFHKEEGSRFSRQARDFDAAVISYLLCRRMGLSTDSFVFDTKRFPQDIALPDFRHRLQKCADMTQELFHRVTFRLKNPNMEKRRANESAFFRKEPC